MTDNQHRAATLVAAYWASPKALTDRIAQALQDAEARGRAEVAAKVEALADLVVQDQHLSGHRLARRLRALIGEDDR